MVATKRIAAAGRTRNTNAHALQIDGQWCCNDCRRVIGQDVFGGKKRRPALRCKDCGRAHFIYLDILTGRQLASAQVARARSAGEIPAPSQFACVDCARPAVCYDHRDYAQPLKVDPVCKSCNTMRGHALPISPAIVLGLLTRLMESAVTTEVA